MKCVTCSETLDAGLVHAHEGHHDFIRIVTNPDYIEAVKDIVAATDERVVSVHGDLLSRMNAKLA